MATRHSANGLDGINFFVASMQAGFGTFVTVYLVRNHWPLQAIGFALTISTVSSLIARFLRAPSSTAFATNAGQCASAPSASASRRCCWR